MVSPLYKIPLVLTAAYTTGVALTPPLPPPDKVEHIKEVLAREKIFGRIVRFCTLSMKFAILGGAVCETAVVLARAFPSHPLSQEVTKRLIWGPASSVARVGISPMFLAGCGVATIAGYIRIRCFRELGKLFTWELTVRDGHKLVTSGPYSVVRHPSYTTLLLGVTAIGLTHAAPGSWYRESGLAGTTLGKGLAWVYFAWMAYAAVNLAARAPQEDEILKKQFGKEWEDYARRVPYRLIPGIY
ncbi:hypothetical protein DAEQUDRAFT_668479 [Daedalea quercina L-15889]|uniref:Protein-S-isoprenylcysteine O-methyltransferase n=1 Tax=Daedalea quercina L-15889 TaxID=1314783 RepID=A0A165QVV7_9APHY|nr:hypothetical protein DAEQUDRAFT_668479 [Daedalea quercina L-15889]